MSSDFTSVLEVGERIVLGDAEIGQRGDRLLLTNKRLLVFEGKGIIKPRYVKIQECSIDQIEEVYMQVDSLGIRLMMRTKGDKEEWEWSFKAPAVVLRGLGAQELSQLAVTNRWVNAINRLIPRPGT